MHLIISTVIRIRITSEFCAGVITASKLIDCPGRNLFVPISSSMPRETSPIHPAEQDKNNSIIIGTFTNTVRYVLMLLQNTH